LTGLPFHKNVFERNEPNFFKIFFPARTIQMAPRIGVVFKFESVPTAESLQHPGATGCGHELIYSFRDVREETCFSRVLENLIGSFFSVGDSSHVHGSTIIAIELVTRSSTSDPGPAECEVKPNIEIRRTPSLAIFSLGNTKPIELKASLKADKETTGIVLANPASVEFILVVAIPDLSATPAFCAPLPRNAFFGVPPNPSAFSVFLPLT